MLLLLFLSVPTDIITLSCQQPRFIKMVSQSVSLRVHSDSGQNSPHHPLSNIDPLPLTRHLSDLNRANKVVVYALSTTKIGRGYRSREFYVLERLSDATTWTSPFDGKPIGVSGRCFKDEWDCGDDLECLEKALNKTGQISKLCPVPLHDKHGQAHCFNLCYPGDATRFIGK